MAPSDSSSNLIHELFAQCDFFDHLTELADVGRLRPVDDSLFTFEFNSNPSLLDRRSLFVASSRLPQKLDKIPGFFDGLLKLAIGLDGERDVLLTAKGIACDRMIRRIGSLFGIPVVELRMAPLNAKKLNRELTAADGCEENVAWLFDFENRGVDFALANLADYVTALTIRKGGNLASALAQRLKRGVPTRVLVDPTLTEKKLTDQLLAAGATGWVLFESEDDDEQNEDPAANYVTSFDSSDFLLHWTRRCSGPWPEQSEDEFLNDLIFRSSRKDHREIASLRRILATQRILAGSDLTRDPRPVVCFSDVTFEKLKELRTFRPHLSRWDFEPFGIAIRKSWLVERGAAAVVYGVESTWESLSDEKRAFFQLNDPDGKVDWSIEKEWRIIGDVDLRKVPVDAAVVFVRTAEDANEVAAFCRWPIVVIGPIA